MITKLKHTQWNIKHELSWVAHVSADPSLSLSPGPQHQAQHQARQHHQGKPDIDKRITDKAGETQESGDTSGARGRPCWLGGRRRPLRGPPRSWPRRCTCPGPPGTPPWCCEHTAVPGYSASANKELNAIHDQHNLSLNISWTLEWELN